MIYFISDLEFPAIGEGYSPPQAEIDKATRRIAMLNMTASRADVIVHVGDFVLARDYDVQDSMKSYAYYLEQIRASVVNILGNHIHDRMYSLSPCMRIALGSKVDAIVLHKPMLDINQSLRDHLASEHVHVCIHGHIGLRRKYFYNESARVLNINVNAYAWRSRPVSEHQLLDLVFKLNYKHLFL